MKSLLMARKTVAIRPCPHPTQGDVWESLKDAVTNPVSITTPSQESRLFVEEKPMVNGCIGGSDDEDLMEVVEEGSNRNAVVEDGVQILLDPCAVNLGYLKFSSVLLMEGDADHTNTVMCPSNQQ